MDTSIVFDCQDRAVEGYSGAYIARHIGRLFWECQDMQASGRDEEIGLFVAALNGIDSRQVIPVLSSVLFFGQKGKSLDAVCVTGDTSVNDTKAALAGIAAVHLIGEPKG